MLFLLWIEVLEWTKDSRKFTDIKVIWSDWWKRVNNAVSEHRLRRPTRGQTERVTEGETPRTFEHEGSRHPSFCPATNPFAATPPPLLYGQLWWQAGRRHCSAAGGMSRGGGGRDCFWCVHKHELISSQGGRSCMHAPRDCVFHTHNAVVQRRYSWQGWVCGAVGQVE